MGFIVYEHESGRMVKYYKSAAAAKTQVTKHNREWVVAPRYYGLREWRCVSYRDFEGILMGLRGDALKMWQFCNSKNG